MVSKSVAEIEQRLISEEFSFIYLFIKTNNKQNQCRGVPGCFLKVYGQPAKGQILTNLCSAMISVEIPYVRSDSSLYFRLHIYLQIILELQQVV